MKKKLAVLLSMALMATAVAPFTASADDETIKIAYIGPLTGNYETYGRHQRQAIELAVEQINEAGGINGYQVEVKFQDDEHDPEKSVNAYNTLKDWGMQILEGTVTSKPCQAVAAETLNDNMFQLTPSGSSPACVTGDNAFAVCFSDPAQGAASAVYIGEHSLAEKVAIIYNSQDVYSSGIYETFMAEVESQPFEVVAAEAFTDDTSKDFSVQLQKAQEAGADLVFLPIYYDPAYLILTQAAGMGYSPVFFGVDGMDGILGVEGFDTTLAEGVLLLTPFVAASEDEKTVNFVEKYKAANNDEIPNQFAADAYDGLYIIKQAIEEAGLTPDMEISDLCDALKVKMTEITYDGLTGTGTTWDASGAVTKDPNAVIIENGTYVSAE